MPLFMDLHIISDITVDELKRAYIADLELQDKYNVEYHQFWVNPDAFPTCAGTSHYMRFSQSLTPPGSGEATFLANRETR